MRKLGDVKKEATVGRLDQRQASGMESGESHSCQLAFQVLPLQRHPAIYRCTGGLCVQIRSHGGCDMMHAGREVAD